MSILLSHVKLKIKQLFCSFEIHACLAYIHTFDTFLNFDLFDWERTATLARSPILAVRPTS